MKSWHPLMCATVVAGIWAAVAIPSPVAGQAIDPPTNSPAARQSEPNSDIDALVRQLGDVDFRKRDAAVAALKQRGSDALPALKRASESDDPEVAGRAAGIIQSIGGPFVQRFPRYSRIDFHPAVAEPNGINVMRLNIRDGVRQFSVRENDGRIVLIVETVDGIQMAVSRTDENGKTVTRHFQAQTVKQLWQQDPEAAALYERWSGRAGGFRIDARGMQRFRPAVRPPPMHADVGKTPTVDELRQRIRQLDRRHRGDVDGNAFRPEALQQEVLDLLEEVQRLHDANGAASALPDDARTPRNRTGD